MTITRGFHPSAPVLDALDRAFPVKPDGWGITHWDCDLIWDDEFKTSSVRIRRYADVNAYDTLKMVRVGLEVEVVLNKLNATLEELETAMLRACREFVPGHWKKTPYVGWDGEHSFPGYRFEILWG